MKTLLESAGKQRVDKTDVQKVGNTNRWVAYDSGTVSRSDGSRGTDKTAGGHSRPGAKARARQENRAINKRARQILKRNMMKEE